MTFTGCPRCGGEEHVVKPDGVLNGKRGAIMGCRACGWFGMFSECYSLDDERIHLVGQADREYATRIEATRVTLEFAQRSTKRLDSGRDCIEDSELFGGKRQQGFFD